MRTNIKAILTILVIFLLGTNIAVIYFYQSNLKQNQSINKKKSEIPENQYGKFFFNELNLDNTQQYKFKEFRRDYNKMANQTLREMQYIRTQMSHQLNMVNPDREQLDKLSDELGEKHKILKGLTFDYYFSMQSILNKEQQEKLVVIFQSMLNQDGDMVTPGQRGKGRHGQGRGFNKQINTDTLLNNK